MQDFYATIHCKAGIHCTVCRSTGSDGVQFRESIAKTFQVPSVNFDCPKKIPWDSVVKIPPKMAEQMKPKPPCTHLSKDPVGSADRKCCGGRVVQTPVYECALKKKKVFLADCNRCGQRT